MSRNRVLTGNEPLNKGARGMINVTKALQLLLMTLVGGCALTSCQLLPAKSPDLPPTAALSIRNNCYSLLHQLLSEEKDVSKLHFIKREQPDLEKLIKRISEASASGAKLLEDFARNDPSIPLDAIQLPSGEKATRASIASTKKLELLGQKGDKFELTLLLSQAEALSYGWHLAKVAGENEPQPEHARALKGISKDMEDLYRETFALLLSGIK